MKIQNLTTRKKLILLIAILLFIIANIKFIYAEDCVTPPCYGVSCQCLTWGAWGNRCIFMVLPEFPTCSLKVCYCYRQCNTNALCTEVYIQSIALTNPWCGNCTDLISYITNSVSHAIHIRHELFQMITRSNFSDFLSKTPPNTWPKCSEPGVVRYKAFAYEAACIFTCYTQHPVSDPSIDLLITYRNCSDVFCCIIEERFCVRDDGSISQEEFKEPGGAPNCSSYQPPITDCPQGENLSWTECADPCTID